MQDVSGIKSNASVHRERVKSSPAILAGFQFSYNHLGRKQCGSFEDPVGRARYIFRFFCGAKSRARHSERLLLRLLNHSCSSCGGNSLTLLGGAKHQGLVDAIDII
jgi:hypothetical protein